jgi:hypothetical protein
MQILVVFEAGNFSVVSNFFQHRFFVRAAIADLWAPVEKDASMRFNAALQICNFQLYFVLSPVRGVWYRY